MTLQKIAGNTDTSRFVTHTGFGYYATWNEFLNYMKNNVAVNIPVMFQANIQDSDFSGFCHVTASRNYGSVLAANDATIKHALLVNGSWTIKTVSES